MESGLNQVLPARAFAPARHRLIREEPRATVPGRGIPLVTTDQVLRRFGVGWIGDLQHQLLAAAAERELHPSPDTVLA